MVETPPIQEKKKPIFLMVLCALVGIFAICALVFVLSYQTPEGQVRELVAQANAEIEAGNFSQANDLLDEALEIEDASNHTEVPVIRELLDRKKQEAEHQRELAEEQEAERQRLLAEEQQAQEAERQRELAEEQQSQEAERQRLLAEEQRIQEAKRLATEEKLQRVKDEEMARLRETIRKELELARKAEEDKKPKEVEPLSLPDVLQQIFPSVVVVKAGNGHGSGFVIGPDLICTNHHVIDGAGSVKVVFKGGATRKAQGTRFKSESMDIAILKVQGVPVAITALELHLNEPRQGEKVYAIGAPMGFKETVTDGIVSKIHSETSARENLGLSGKWIQTNAEINSGNSGGPLINSRGVVVGMSTLGSNSQLGLVNINFATSASNIAKALRVAKSGELSAFEARPKRKPEREQTSRGDPVTTYYANGQKELEYHSKNGEFDGRVTAWHENGQKKSEGHFKNGKGEGRHTLWYENGQKEIENHYKNDKEHGLKTWWYDNGQKKIEQHWKNGKRDGLETRWHQNGRKWYEAYIENGFVISERRF